jgi:probable rRNA maturation factor
VSDSPSIILRNAQRRLRVDAKELRRFCERALRLCLQEPYARGGELDSLDEISIVLVSDRRMAALHKQFMNIDGPTDVLTFQHGEIFASVETAQENAAQFGTTVEDEIRLYVVHGLLHLRGFDDIAPADARRMDSVQQRILAAAAAA